ncbi:hypothetical protein [endosymbiont GvMRE of Glomus versiforme]|uniref:hypothetical protein n=1 Tax=endosymbiont GvMRE of Glomus versiforme TaxID=2039283 RepID=UPI000EC5AD5E|nr:hypothetical protein [endosymbiont GvMRE of Glomus versiforme]RHZ36648.1 hypothetical protein GvMRE_I2g544 [endosymbiont GvMRE of Glomus versiforme]
MDYQPLMLFSAIAAIGYVVFHGHRANQDCWLCPFRGIAFITGSLGLGIVASIDT